MKTINTLLENSTSRVIPIEPAGSLVSDNLVLPVVISQTIIDDFEMQVRFNPDKSALVFKDQVITYNELNRKSNQFAHYLKKKGLQKGTMVCICLEQSIEKVVSMLAVLKTGCAYVPIDTKYPVNRISFILNDTNAPFLITSATVFSMIGSNRANVICIDDQNSLEAVVNQIDTNPGVLLEPSDLAYVIYTSGSTGTPKGVLIEHRSLKAFIDNHRPVLGISENSKTLQFSSTSFDAAVIDLWIPLVTGATLYLYPDNRVIGVHLLDFIRDNEIDVLPLISPTVLSSFPLMEDIGKLRTIGIGGEACPVRTLEHWYNKVQLINAYGPTEATVAVTNFLCRPGYAEKTIGKPMPGVQLYILDEKGNEVADGAAGELHIGGVQVARGYLNSPELTVEKFVENFRDNTGQPIRLYKTGDMVKKLSDGNLEFAGRKDDQVKLRGYRIELGEIEIAINRLDGIKHAVVVPRDGKHGLVLLTAFVVAENIQAESELRAQKSRWRQQLTGQLPTYMIPDRFELLPDMPVNVHGKIDKDKLQLSDENEAAIELRGENIDENDYEGIIYNIWSRLLNSENIGQNDDFFALGGHSLLLIHVYNALPEAIKSHIQIPDLYVFSTIRNFSEEIRKRKNALRLSAKEKEMLIIEELLRDATLREKIEMRALPDPAVLLDPQCIFLTGATGFVGAHLLFELLTQTDADIYCLVRAADAGQAMQRLRVTFEKFRLIWEADKESRILPVIGDLSKPDFGMEKTEYDILTDKTQIIYHSGSSVSYLQPYPVIKSSNIDGLHQIIRLTTTGNPKYLALLSSMGVFSWGRPFTGKTWMYENDDINQNLSAVSKDLGYIKSKWVMEKMIQEAMSKGLQVINFRLGFAVCNEVTGATVMSQWWGSLVRSCVQLGAFPLVMGLKDELTTVDYMTKAIVHIARKKEAVGTNFHLSPEPENDVSMTDFFAKINEYYGLGLRGIPYDEWLDLWKKKSDNPLYPLLSLFTDDVHEGKSLVEAYENTYYYDRSNTRKFLSDSALKPPVFNEALMTPYLQYMGILP